jgi:hypothetical protein
MKKGRGESKDSRRITMSVIAAISPNETNWGRRGGYLGFLVYLFSALPTRVQKQIWPFEIISSKK